MPRRTARNSSFFLKSFRQATFPKRSQKHHTMNSNGFTGRRTLSSRNRPKHRYHNCIRHLRSGRRKALQQLQSLWNRGGCLANYRKLNLFPRSAEPAVFSHGGSVTVFSLHGFTVGLLICYDIRFPELSRRFVDAGCKLVLVSSAWPRSRVSNWRTLLAARAIENQMYVAASNHTGSFGSAAFAGHSMIVDPSGTVIAEAGTEHEAVVRAELSSGTVDELRTSFPFHSDRERLLEILRRLRLSGSSC